MDFKEIQELITIVDESNLTTMELEKDGLRLVLKKEIAQGMFPGQTPNVQPVERQYTSGEFPGGESSGGQAATGAGYPADQMINSPIVGTFYVSSSPEDEPFVQAGSRVKKGDTLCIIEAMKLMNEIEADEDLQIVEVFVQDGQMVEYDQPLFAVSKT